MAATEMKERDPWLIDDSVPYDPAAMAAIDIPPELQAKIDAIFDDDPTPTEVLSAA